MDICSADALFRQWKALLTQHGIRRIQGRIIGDGSAWEGNLEHPSWGFDDLGTYYGTGGNALCFYRNTIDYAVSAAAEGESVNFRQTYPAPPWMHLANYSVTGPAGRRWRFLPSEWSPDSDTGPFSRQEMHNGRPFRMAVLLEMLIFAVR